MTNPEHARRSREAGLGLLTLQCVRCFNAYETLRLSDRLCADCKAAGATDSGELSGS